MYYFKTDVEERAFFDPILKEQFYMLNTWNSLGRLGPMVNRAQKSTHKTALMLAAEREKGELLNLLLSLPEIDINLKNPLGQTALRLAIENRAYFVVQRLLQDPRTHIDFEDIILAGQMDFSMIHSILIKYKLYIALQTKCLKTLTTLYDMGLLREPLINEVMFEGSGLTPLMYAIDFEDTEAISFLLKLPNLDVNKKNPNNSSALDQALLGFNDNVLHKILAAPNLWIDKMHLLNARNINPFRLRKLNALFIKPPANIFVRLPDQIDFFCEMKDNNYSIPEVKDWVNTINKVNHMTPLMWVAQHGHLKTLEYLLSIPGLNLNVQTPKEQMSALFFAVKNNQLEMVMALLKTGRLNLARDAETAIMLAENSYRAIATIIKNSLPKKASGFRAWIEQNKIDDIDSDHLCPISYELMLDPVTTSTGFTFERTNLIQHYFKSQNFCCPFTSVPLTRDQLDFAPSQLVKNNIQKYMEKKKKQWEDAKKTVPESNIIILPEGVVPTPLEDQSTFFAQHKKRKFESLQWDPPSP